MNIPPSALVLLQRDEFPLSAHYDPAWVMENLMGPNVLWLAESLSQVMDLRPGMRILDMGCGKAVSSIFFAREFGVQVWAVDLWISASENWLRICSAGLDQQVYPIHAEAHQLPFADGFFDAAVSLDAYHYFGTDDLYLGNYFARLVRPGGQIGIVVPGLVDELDSIPDELLPYWEWEFASFHSPAWWRKCWSAVPGVQVSHADLVPNGWQHWLDWLQACRLTGYHYSETEEQLLEVDRGRRLGFSRIVARLSPPIGA